MEEKEKQTVDTSPVDVDVGTAADVEEVMKKYDRESNTKIWEGLPKQVIRYAMAAFMIFMVYVSMFSSMDGSVRRCWFLGLILVFVYVMYPVKKGTVTRVNYMPWYDIVLAALSIGTFGYQIYFLDELVYKGSRLDTLDIIVGTLAILLLIEACRRVVGIPIIVVVVVFMCYALLGSGMEFKDLVYTLFYTGQGILGTPIQVCSTYIFLFVLFGAFLEATGIADYGSEAFDVVAVVGKSAGEAVVVRADAPYDTMEELIAYSQAHPQTVKIAANTGATSHWASVVLNVEEDAQLNIVNASSSAERVANLLGGQLDVIINPIGTVQDYVTSGDFKYLAVTTSERLDYLPDVPTCLEQGVNMSYDLMYYVMFPKGTDPAICEKFAAAFKEISEMPEYAEEIKTAYNQTPYFLDTEESITYIQEENEKMMAYADYFK